MEINVFPVAMIAVFLIGYVMIIFEHLIDINKATSALMMGVLCWVLQFTGGQNLEGQDGLSDLFEHLANISQVIIFLLGAMIIVEIINTHKGFKFITDHIHLKSKRKLLWLVGTLTFFLSSVLDNLTTTIVMVSIIQKILDDPQDRMLMGGGIVVAANAGGAWTPIGDITTTMLWIGGQVSTLGIMAKLIIPSLICFGVSFFLLTFQLKGDLPEKTIGVEKKEPLGIAVLLLGISTLIFVPIFKLLTGLPPFIGMIFGLSVMWFFTDIAHRKGKNRDYLRVSYNLSKVDISGPLFFLGILLAVNALETAGSLTGLSALIDNNISSFSVTATIIGLASSVVDNIPLVAATMGMYDLLQYPSDASFWQLIAYCAGTGGSILIIGSAAGVVYMSMEKVDFFSYLKKISTPALAGYFAGILAYLMLT